MKKRRSQSASDSCQRQSWRRQQSARLKVFTSLLIVGLSIAGAQSASDKKPFAEGNLFVVFNAASGKSSNAFPLRDPELKDLWCQASRDEESHVNIESARFVQIIPRPPREHQAHLSNEQRAYLHFADDATVAVAGKYHCEITTTDGDFVSGNLFVYLRPIFHTNNTIRLDQVDDDQPFKFSAQSVKVTRGDTARLICPTIGYPPPQVRWLRNAAPIALNETKYRQLPNGELHILETDDPDEGLYECVAENKFPLHFEGEDHIFQARLQQQLHVSSSLSWLIPLIVIVVIIILLFIIIYACAWWKRRQYAQYHVAKKEKCLPMVENANTVEEIADDD